MPIYGVNINSSLDSIIQGTPDGLYKQFLIEVPCKKELDYLVYYACQISNEGITPFIRVQFDWGYGQRARKLDLVGIKNGELFIYKKSKRFSTDSHALDLSRLSEQIKKHYPDIKVSCVLLFSENIDIDVAKSTINSLGLDVSIKIII